MNQRESMLLPVAVGLLAVLAVTGCAKDDDRAADVVDVAAVQDVPADASAVDTNWHEDLVPAPEISEVGPDVMVEVEPPDTITGLDCNPLPTVELRPLAEALAQGELVMGEVLFADPGAEVVLPAVNGDEQYLLILYDMSTENDKTYDYQVTTGRLGALEMLPEAKHLISDPAAMMKHHKLLDPRDLALAPVPVCDSAEPPEVGSVEVLQARSGLLIKEVEAEVMLVTDELVMYKDTTTENPLEEVSLETMAALAGYFGDLIRPRERFFWGQESDVNGDGRVAMLFSYLVNTEGAYAYVTQCDLLDPSVCAYGNQRELIYVAIPDPAEQINSPEAFAELIAHEFNHAIYFSRKFLSSGLMLSGENVYITEGMSAMAQDLTGFNRGNLFVAMAALTGIDDVSLSDMHRYDPETHYYAARDGALRGASYLFIRYLFDQAGGHEQTADGGFVDNCAAQFLRDWVDSPSTGPELIAAMTGLPYEETAANWFTALALSNRPGTGDGSLDLDPAFSYRPITTDPVTNNQHGIDLWGSVLGMVPLYGPTVREVEQADGVLRSGGVEYLRVTATDPGDIIVTFDIDNQAVPGLRVVRLGPM